MRVHRGKAVLLGVTALTVVIAGCSSSGKGSGSSGGSGGHGTLIYGESTDFPENLMPLISAGNSTAGGNLEINLLRGAYSSTPAIQYEPDPDQMTSADSTMVNGQQVVDIKINPKAVWADGQPITAADYVFSVSPVFRSNDPKKDGCASVLSTTGYNQIQDATAVNDHEVKITFLKGKSYADWKGLFSAGNGGFALASKHVMDKGSAAATCAYITKGWPTAQGIPLGAQNGPWLLTAKNIDVPNKTFTLTPNPKYWGAKPKLAKLVDAYIGSDSDTNVKALQNQEVNMIYPQPQLDLVSNLQKLSGVTTEINFGVQFEHLDFNTKDPLLSHIQIREAIALAIDRKALVQATVGKFSDKATVLGNRIVMPNQQGYVDNGAAYAAQNIAKAKSLLTSVGCTMGSGGIYTCFGKPLSFQVMTTQNNPLRDQTIQTIAQQVKAAGIKLTEFASPDIFAGTDKPHSLTSEGFQIALFAWVGGPSLSSNASIYQSPSRGQGQNYTQIGTPQIDAALDKMSGAPDITAETAAANAADKLLWDQMATLPLYQKPTLLAFDSNFKGIADNATQAGPLWNSQTFSVS